MAGIKNLTVANLLKKWLKDAGITQVQLAMEEGVTQVVISRQLSGQESIPIDRIKKIIKLTNPAPDELAFIDYFVPAESTASSDGTTMVDMHDAINSIGVDDELYMLLLEWPDIPREQKDLHITPLLDYMRRMADEADKEFMKNIKHLPKKTVMLGKRRYRVPIRDGKGLIPDPKKK